jgi:hypothetical protein
MVNLIKEVEVIYKQIHYSELTSLSKSLQDQTDLDNSSIFLAFQMKCTVE